MSWTQSESLSIPNLDRKSSYQVRQNLALFCKLVAIILGLNCLKGLKIFKIVKEIKFEEVWDKLKAKNYLQRQLWTKYLRKTLVFM